MRVRFLTAMIRGEDVPFPAAYTRHGTTGIAERYLIDSAKRLRKTDERNIRLLRSRKRQVSKDYKFLDRAENEERAYKEKLAKIRGSY